MSLMHLRRADVEHNMLVSCNDAAAAAAGGAAAAAAASGGEPLQLVFSYLSCMEYYIVLVLTYILLNKMETQHCNIASFDGDPQSNSIDCSHSLQCTARLGTARLGSALLGSARLQCPECHCKIPYFLVHQLRWFFLPTTTVSVEL